MALTFFVKNFCLNSVKKIVKNDDIYIILKF